MISQAAPTALTNACAPSEPLTSSTRGSFGRSTMVRAAHKGVAILYCCSCIGCSTALVAGSSCMMPSGRVHHTTDCGVSHEICRSAVQLPARRLRRSG